MTQAAQCPAPDYDPPKQRWLTFGELETWLVLIVVVLAMAIMILQPKIKGRLRIWRFSFSANTIPPAFTAMIVTTVIGNVLYSHAFGQHIHLIGDVATFSGQVPQAHVPNVPWGSGEFWGLGLRYGLLLALVGSIESIMTWKLCQQIIDRPVPIAQSKWEVYSQGIGNLFASFFGSIGGSVMVGQSIVNFTNGARGRVSTTVAAIIIFIIASVAGKAIEVIPLATLTGILFAVVLNMFEWKTFQYLFRLSLPLTDLAAIILVTVLAVTTDLAIAVLIGIAWCSVCFAWKSSTHAQVRQDKGMQPDMVVTLEQAQTRLPQQLHPQTTAVVKLEGIVFFGSTADIMQYFLEFAWEGYQVVVLDLSKAVFYDSSGVEVLRGVAHEVITKHQRQLILIDASEANYGLLGRSHLLRSIMFEMTPAELTDDKDGSIQTAIMTGMELDPTKFEEARQATTAGWMGSAEDRRLATTRLYEDNHLYHRTLTRHSV
ncbi:hypothetical protein H4R35_004720 [Dimargaris xerosporica]|nr:hypothetical protein H4R35_004720 [Dimargaris xerosporica]